nr:MAG: hypothetical protein [Bacteriophage sp.]
MAKKLNEDEIKWILSVESSKAQQEIRKLTKVNRELNKTNKERRELMRELEAQGKKESDEYQRLDEEIKKSNKTISTNNKLIGELEKKLDVTGLTMVQLRKKAKDLRQQLDQTVKSTHPEEYAELEAELAKVNSRMEELRGTGKYAQQQLTAFDKTMNMAKMAAKGFIAVQLVRYLKDVGMKSYETRKEYARFEATLRNATGSSEEAAKAMKMLQQLAKDTPASVSEWTESYIKLVNRGIKPTTDELTAMGDIAMSQGKDIDQFIEALLDAMTGENERLKEFGITASKNGKTTAYTFRGVTTEVQNTDMAIKNYILSLGKLQGVQGSMATQMNELAGLESNLGDQMESIYNKIGKKLEPAIKSFMGTLGKIMGTISGYLDSTNEKFEDQIGKVISLQTKLGPLLSRYDELKIKTNLSAAEQSELNSLIKEIARIVPSAVSEWNDYGEAISVNTEKAKEFIETEKKRLAYINRGQIEETQSNIESYKKTVDIYTKLLKEGGKWKTDRKTGDMFFVQFSNEELQDFKKKLDEAQQLLEGSYEQMKVLTGQTIEEQINSRIERNKKMEEAQSKFNKMNKSMLAAWIADEKNATNEYLSLAKEIYKNRFPDIPVDPKEIEKAAKKEKKAILDTEKDVLKSIEDMRTDDLQKRDEWYNKELSNLQSSLSSKKITQVQYNAQLATLTKNDAEARLMIEKGYYDDLQSLVLKNENIKESAIRVSNQRVLDADKALNNARFEEEKGFLELFSKYGQEYKTLTLKEERDLQIKILEETYEKLKEIAKNNNGDLLQLEKDYLNAKNNLEESFDDKEYEIREKFDLLSKKDIYEKQLDELQSYYDRGKLTTEEYYEAMSKMILKYHQEQIDSFKNYGSQIGEAVGNIISNQEGALAAFGNTIIDIMFDVLTKIIDTKMAEATAVAIAEQAKAAAISAAQPDSVATFGATAAARTAIISGLIMAALATAKTALKGLISKKGSSITSGDTSSNTSYTRVPGRQSGGYIDVTRAQDGKEFQAVYDPKRRGFIDKPTVIVGEGPAGSSKEWVASNEAVKNPTIAPILSILDQAQQAGTIRTLDLNKYLQAQAIGRQSGGGIQSATVPSPTVQPDLGLSRSIKELNDTLLLLKKDGLPAYTLLDDFDKARKLQERSRKIGSKR